jgi:hypothetical protein
MKQSIGTGRSETVLLVVFLTITAALLWGAVQRADWFMVVTIGMGMLLIVLWYFRPKRRRPRGPEQGGA